jgi:hypothetical protein
MIQGGIPMSTYSKKHEEQLLEKVGKLLAKRLREAREKKGVLVCPVCQTTFDATYCMKCPDCRTFIDSTFKAVQEEKKPESASKEAEKKVSEKQTTYHKKGSRKMELDFFTEGYMELLKSNE